MPNMLFEENRVSVSAGDTLFVYTDGLTDRVNRNGDFYSIDRIAAVLESAPDADVDAIYNSIYSDVRDFSATEEFKDDIAFVVTRFH
jgi:sigma-B regulation protein RsbU (phosphoserine phosphatase)